MHSKVAALLSRGALIAVFGAAPLAAGCSVQGSVDEPPHEDVVVEREPPAEQVETPPPAPSATHFWIRGHWRWDGVAWRWTPGQWEIRRTGYEFVTGHWERRPRGYVWIGAHWRRN